MKKQVSYFVLIFLFIIKIIFFFFDIYIPILDFILFGIFLFVFSFFFLKKRLYRNYQNNLAKTVFIIIFSYFIVYYIIGLFIGFNFNSYDTSFLGVL